MSNVKVRNSVMVRAYAGEPVPMVVIASRPGAVEVAREAGSASISLPATDVFELDPARLRRLSAAFAAGDRARLATLWSKAVPYGAR